MKVKGLLFLLLLGLLFLLSASVAKAADVTKMEILGFRLGMSLSEAKDAIKKVAPGAQIKITNKLTEPYNQYFLSCPYVECRLIADVGNITELYIDISPQAFGSKVIGVIYSKKFVTNMNKKDIASLFKQVCSKYGKYDFFDQVSDRAVWKEGKIKDKESYYNTTGKYLACQINTTDLLLELIDPSIMILLQQEMEREDKKVKF